MRTNQLLTILLLLIIGIPLNAQELGYINDPDGYTNIRLETSTKSDIVGIILAGQVFKYYPDSNSEWWKIDFKNRSGFMHKSRIKSYNTVKSEINKFFQDYYSANRNNVELSQGNNEKLFIVTQDYPLATMTTFCEQSKEIKDFLISIYRSPVHDMIDLQLIYSRLISEQITCPEIAEIKAAIKKAGKSIGLEIIENDIDFNKIPEYNKPTERLLGVNKNFTSKINGKPITYYLNHPKVDRFSKLFYQGQFRLFDNSKTFAFIDSVMTSNNDTKPFYFYIFNSVLSQSDGALSEYIAGNCLNYFKTNPCDYFAFASTKEYNINNTTWTAFIGWQLYAKSDYDPFKKQMDIRIKNNCPNNLDSWTRFSNDIYNELEIK